MRDELNFSESDELQLDRLVDGEVTDAQRRQLLEKLDNQPDGWRQCALAFLEAQAWKRGMGEFVCTGSNEETEVSVLPGRRNTWWNSTAGTLLAAAASFLIAFALGLVWRGRSEGPQQAAAPVAPENQTAAASPAPAQTPQQPQWGTLTVVESDPSGSSKSLDLPIVKGPGIDEQWLRSQPSAIPPHVLRALERMGHEVEHQRQYYPFELGNGQRVVVPVDEVNLRYVGERQFQ